MQKDISENFQRWYNTSITICLTIEKTISVAVTDKLKVVETQKSFYENFFCLISQRR